MPLLVHPPTNVFQVLQVQYGTKNSSVKTAEGRAIRVSGKSASITLNASVASTAKIFGVVTVGREDPTAAEKMREAIVLEVLQRKLSFFEQNIVRKIFERPPSKRARRHKPSNRSQAEVYLEGRRLNDTQAAAVNRIMSASPDDQVCLVHGPPGTGKTTVIAASVIELMNLPKKNRGIWLVAQSNVAVKNIAEKLARVDFLDFKVLVSKDFHFEWHEHLYEQIEHNVIRSDEFSEDIVGTERLLLGSKVVLCTLSMLSAPRVITAGFTRLVPVETVIVDEASQIELGDYLPLLGRFSHSLEKLVFIGDDKQLAPFGQDDLGELSSIFEMQHLRQDAIFLDTQYRMPIPIGEFISRHVYGNNLKTSHDEMDRRSCILIDVSHGKETKSSNSWTNDAEATAIVVVARKFHAEGKTYRVITPYDAQRNVLERKLKAANLPWENKCFNVDSFQGENQTVLLGRQVDTSSLR
ncbi:P-loop containing nucleoside triphosphate hydrolase protein [Fomitopsis serialis]|uniref:P-loop containing nucleoside triphosphate hydrolase protein n=1 Tax=Fomitopsis serialis TaxID=139415 RepID=UPI002008021F|nr:P-loop containing nucleoside triphosphate hydrolase protein [Neoantrodia serialis]KAH9917838.1 P-loop containing nucleoside triphosphate hydrolase protein [Neoantrodia serialis]